MLSRWSLQHRTSKRYVVEMPGHHEGLMFSESPDETKASTWDREGAEQAHMALGSFAGAWKVVPLTRTPPSIPDVV